MHAKIVNNKFYNKSCIYFYRSHRIFHRAVFSKISYNFHKNPMVTRSSMSMIARHVSSGLLNSHILQYSGSPTVALQIQYFPDSWGGGRGHWPKKGVWGCAALKTPFSRLSFSLQGSHFKQKYQFTRPPFEKIWKFSLYSLNFCPNLSSQAPKFGNFQLTSPQITKFSVHKPQIWKFSAHKPPFSEASISLQAPHFGNPGRTPLPEKSWVPPPPGIHHVVGILHRNTCHSSICQYNVALHANAHKNSD